MRVVFCPGNMTANPNADADLVSVVGVSVFTVGRVSVFMAYDFLANKLNVPTFFSFLIGFSGFYRIFISEKDPAYFFLISFSRAYCLIL